MAGLPDHYESLGIKPTASLKEIELAHARRAAELRASKVEDAPEELAEIEAAFAVLKDPVQRARYDEDLRKEEAEEDQKYAKLDASLPKHHHRQRVKGSSGLLDAVWDFFSLIFK
jgi:curved DNA-binding protein